jgi:3-oxoacyl-[acyl-carrier protein] reductase
MCAVETDSRSPDERIAGGVLFPEARDQRRALVLGGRGSIGSAIVEALRRDGLSVTGVGRADFDLAVPPQVNAFFDLNGSEFDVLVHSAGWNVPKPFEQLVDLEIRASLDANLHGFLLAARRCLPYWQRVRTGRILVIGSLYGSLGRRDRLPYVMSKHALNGAVRTLAIELAEYGVLVNALSPGYIGTRMTYENNSPQEVANFEAAIPLRRLGTPGDVASVASFLCSTRNCYLTGQNIIVDGGYSAGGFQG